MNIDCLIIERSCKKLRRFSSGFFVAPEFNVPLGISKIASLSDEIDHAGFCEDKIPSKSARLSDSFE
jgi:hypothetical protein